MVENVRGEPGGEVATAEAIFAGGCFWGVEHHFQELDGVISATSGYTGGQTADPDYRAVCTGQTGHAEAVRVVFRPDRVSYEKLARLFFEIHAPTQLNRQGPDVGTQYRSAIFYLDEQQKNVAEKLIAELRAKGYDVVTQVLPASEFYPAEEYHQDYLTKNPWRPTCHVRVPRFNTTGKK
jgi:peptide methionine sulfoxide reductase msrA/msrB